MRILKAKPTDPAAQEDIRRLQQATLPGDVLVEPDTGHWWLCKDGDKTVGFIGLHDLENWPVAAYVSRCGVIASHRGKRLQQRMLKAVERWAIRSGLTTLVSTTYDNPPSANSFIACGYKSYEPATRWGADGTVYWRKVLT